MESKRQRRAARTNNHNHHQLDLPLLNVAAVPVSDACVSVCERVGCG